MPPGELPQAPSQDNHAVCPPTHPSRPKPPMSESPLPERQHALLDERVFNFAQAAQRHFKTNDLVVLLDFRAETPELCDQPPELGENLPELSSYLDWQAVPPDCQAELRQLASTVAQGQHAKAA